MSVWENTVPATIGNRRRRDPSSLRVSTTTRVGSPMRPGNTAEAITPIIVARTTGRPADRCLGQRRAQHLMPGDRAQQERQRHQRERQHDPAGRRGDQGVADAVEFEPRQREHDQPRHED